MTAEALAAPAVASPAPDPGPPPLERFVSPLTGVVAGLTEILAAPDELRLPSVGCEVSDARPTVGFSTDAYTGCSHPDRGAARAAAIGEALERYAATYVPEEDLVVEAAADLDGAVDPLSFALFSREQHAAPGFPFQPFRPETVVAWVRGTSVPDGRPVWLPAQLVYMPWRRLSKGEVRIGHATSSGLACGPTRDDALLAALLELVERDAFMLVWKNRLSLPRVDWSADRWMMQFDKRYFAPSGLRYSAVDLSVFFGVPTVLGVVHGAPGQLGALGVGAASARSVQEAWRKALAEAFSVQRWVRDRALEEPELLDAEAQQIDSFDAHTMFYARAERAAGAGFLDASAETCAATDVAPLAATEAGAATTEVAALLARRSISAYAADVTTCDLAAAGLHVVRAVAPQLCALDVLQRTPFLGGDRLYRASFEAGAVARPLEPADLNLAPHPFP
jgi:ribosomal protein S12 methylthiotransferase accessory factor